jgi:hypothetical protein
MVAERPPKVQRSRANSMIEATSVPCERVPTVGVQSPA